MKNEDDEVALLSRSAELECEIVVLKDLLARAQWYLGNDIQSSPPTKEELAMFLEETRGVLWSE